VEKCAAPKHPKGNQKIEILPMPLDSRRFKSGYDKPPNIEHMGREDESGDPPKCDRLPLDPAREEDGKRNGKVA